MLLAQWSICFACTDLAPSKDFQCFRYVSSRCSSHVANILHEQKNSCTHPHQLAQNLHMKREIKGARKSGPVEASTKAWWRVEKAFQGCRFLGPWPTAPPAGHRPAMPREIGNQRPSRPSPEQSAHTEGHDFYWGQSSVLTVHQWLTMTSDPTVF